jgi:hypothetical protein
VLACNLLRRHLKPEERQELLIKLIARRPEWSNRQIAKEAGVNRKAVDRARAKGEDVGQVAHVSRRLDSTGRSQPLRAKAKPAKGLSPVITGKATAAEYHTANRVINVLEYFVAEFDALDLAAVARGCTDDDKAACRISQGIEQASKHINDLRKTWEARAT